jgi:hypothetical protein
VDVGLLKKIVAVKLAEGLSPATVRLLMRLASTLCSAARIHNRGARVAARRVAANLVDRP